MKRLLLLVALFAAACSKETVTPPPAHPSAPAASPVAYVRDPHSYARPSEVRVAHLALDRTVDFAKKQLSGTATLDIRHDAAATALILDTDDLAIHSVKLQPGNTPAQFSLAASDPILGERLQIAIKSDTSAVTIDYTTSPTTRALQWLEPAMTAGKKHPFLLSQSEAILARTWVPLQDTQQVRFTYDATLHVPKELMAVMSAENPQARNEEGVYRFRMPQPVPSYLLAVAVGDLEFRPFDTRSGVYAEPRSEERRVGEEWRSRW